MVQAMSTSNSNILNLPTELRHQVIHDLVFNLSHPSDHIDLTPHAPLPGIHLDELLDCIRALALTHYIFAQDIHAILVSPISTLYELSHAADRRVAAIRNSYRQRLSNFAEMRYTGQWDTMRDFRERLDCLELRTKWKLSWEGRREEKQKWGRLREIVSSAAGYEENGTERVQERVQGGQGEPPEDLERLEEYLEELEDELALSWDWPAEEGEYARLRALRPR